MERGLTNIETCVIEALPKAEMIIVIITIPITTNKIVDNIDIDPTTDIENLRLTFLLPMAHQI